MSSISEAPSLDVTVFVTFPLLIDMDETDGIRFTKIGLLLLSGLLSMALWGASMVQLYFYFEKYSKYDKWMLQSYVLFTWAVDTVHQGILCRTIYVLFVKHFADVSYLNHIPENSSAEVVLQTMVDALVQLLFLVRIWHLSDKSIILTGVNALFIAGLLSVNLLFFAKTVHFTVFSQNASIQGIITALNSLIALVDLSIAITLVILLQRRRSRYKSTDSVVKRLMMYSISTGLITGLWSIIGLAGVIAMPQSNLDVFVDLILPRLYVNCMLFSLNSRASLRNELSGASDYGKSIQLSTFDAQQTNTGTRTLANESPCRREMRVKVDIDTVGDYDRQESFSRSSFKV